jgi:hypothetical protein
MTPLAASQLEALRGIPLVLDDQHRYWQGPVEYASLSAVLLAGGFKEDFAGVPQAVLNRKRDIGRAVHAAAQFILEDCLDWSTVDEAARPYVEAFASWNQKHQPTGAILETPICNPQLGYACTPDILRPSAKEVIEIKTSLKISKFVGIQLAGQVICAEEGEPYSGRFDDWTRLVLQLKKDGTYSYGPAKDYGNPYDAMRAALVAFGWKKAAGIRF